MDIDLDGKATGCRHMPKFGLGDSKAKTPHQKGDLDVDIDVEGKSKGIHMPKFGLADSKAKTPHQRLIFMWTLLFQQNFPKEKLIWRKCQSESSKYFRRTKRITF